MTIDTKCVVVCGCLAVVGVMCCVDWKRLYKQEAVLAVDCVCRCGALAMIVQMIVVRIE